MIRKLLIDEGAGEGLEILEREISHIHRDLVLGETNLETETHLLSSTFLRHDDDDLIGDGGLLRDLKSKMFEYDGYI